MAGEFAEALRNFGLRRGLADLAFDEDGSAALRLDDRRIIGLILRPDDSLALVEPLCPVVDDSAFYTILLQINALSESQDGIRLGLSPDQAFVAATTVVPVADAGSLESRLEDFADAAGHWSNCLSRILAERDNPEPPAPPIADQFRA